MVTQVMGEVGQCRQRLLPPRTPCQGVCRNRSFFRRTDNRVCLEYQNKLCFCNISW